MKWIIDFVRREIAVRRVLRFYTNDKTQRQALEPIVRGYLKK